MLSNKKGFTLVEIIMTIALVSILTLGLNGLVGGVYEQWQYGSSRQELMSQGNFAMARIIEAVNATRRMLIPLGENPATAYSEAERDILAVTLDPGLDRDVDGFFDGDNDKDGLIDEDIPADNTFDGAPGIIGIDDDNDGFVDEKAGTGPCLGGGGVTLADNDEDCRASDDHIDGLDNDGDGSIDEDITKENDKAGGNANNDVDNDGDGLKNEDWFDPVVFFVSAAGTQLIERMPVINPIDGTAYSEYPIAEADHVAFKVQRLPAAPGDRAELLQITLLLSSTYGGEVIFESLVRIGGGK